jgi:hypothetical protein
MLFASKCIETCGKKGQLPAFATCKDCSFAMTPHVVCSSNNLSLSIAGFRHDGLEIGLHSVP